MLAWPAFVIAGIRYVRFLPFCPRSCLSGHDNKADIHEREIKRLNRSVGGLAALAR